jgi:hypothetical protein
MTCAGGRDRRRKPQAAPAPAITASQSLDLWPVHEEFERPRLRVLSAVERRAEEEPMTDRPS